MIGTSCFTPRCQGVLYTAHPLTKGAHRRDAEQSTMQSPITHAPMRTLNPEAHDYLGNLCVEPLRVTTPGSREKCFSPHPQRGPGWRSTSPPGIGTNKAVSRGTRDSPWVSTQVTAHSLTCFQWHDRGQLPIVTSDRIVPTLAPFPVQHPRILSQPLHMGGVCPHIMAPSSSAGRISGGMLIAFYLVLTIVSYWSPTVSIELRIASPPLLCYQGLEID
jgi:hypothetical protein